MDNTKLDKVLEANKEKFNDWEELSDFINSYEAISWDQLREQSSEYADSLVPIYYNDIIKEWAENDDCHEMTVEVCGEYGQEDIYKMMQSDLYFYQEQRLIEDIDTLEELVKA